MQITIVTVYRHSDCEHFVGAVTGRLTDEQKDTLAHMHNTARIDDPAIEDNDGEINQIFFRESVLSDSVDDLGTVLNIDGETYATV